MNTLSIITVAYNESKNLSRLKNSIDAQQIPKGWRIETVLVDNGSHDDTALIAGRLGYIRVVSQPRGTIATCRNRGFEVSSGDLIAYVDADCELSQGWVERVIDALGDQITGIIGWPVTPPIPMTWVQRAWHAHWTNKRGHITSALAGERAMTLITTANMSMTRSTMESVGGFDATLHSGEDMNFLLRAFHLGIPTIALPSLNVVHHGEPRSLRAFYHQQRWHCSKSSFRSILRANGGVKGGNAVWYTLLFAVFLALAVCGVLYAIITQRLGWGLMFISPFTLLLFGPALMIVRRSGKIMLQLQLPVLYFIYGWVRVSDWLGVGRKKRSWRS